MSERRECHVCGRSVSLTLAGKYRQHGGCMTSGTFPPDAPPPPDAPEIPGATEYVRELGKAAMSTTPFVQPSGNRRPTQQPQEMTELGKEVAARIKETFYAYTNRMERSQQATMGPSEIGSPCDRRIAMSLMRVPPVNPGGDNWSSFVGTCVHEGLARMFLWANAGSGRYAVEMPLSFPSVHVPHGTGDLLDRTLCMFLDHKAMGRWSLDKLRSSGPSTVYRVQVHTYAYGARLAGEEVDHVAIVGWPRQGSSLDDLYVWTEPYDPAVARDALARVRRIAEQVNHQRDHVDSTAEIAATFPIDNSDCRFCPYHKPGAPDLKGGGCNGR